jgi:hypothetical protein
MKEILNNMSALLEECIINGYKGKENLYAWFLEERKLIDEVLFLYNNTTTKNTEKENKKMSTKRSSKIERAMNTLSEAFKNDPDYAHSWHCNIACMAMDAGASHEVANEGASRFMKLAFGVETNEGVCYNDEYRIDSQIEAMKKEAQTEEKWLEIRIKACKEATQKLNDIRKRMKG